MSDDKPNLTSLARRLALVLLVAGLLPVAYLRMRDRWFPPGPSARAGERLPGSTGLAHLVLRGLGATEGLHPSIAPVADLDGDGRPDLAVLARSLEAGVPARLELRSSRTGELISQHLLPDGGTKIDPGVHVPNQPLGLVTAHPSVSAERSSSPSDAVQVGVGLPKALWGGPSLAPRSVPLIWEFDVSTRSWTLLLSRSDEIGCVGWLPAASGPSSTPQGQVRARPPATPLWLVGGQFDVASPAHELLRYDAATREVIDTPWTSTEFGPPARLATGHDFDGDGVADLAVGHCGRVEVLSSIDGRRIGPLYTPPGESGATDTRPLPIGDLDGDGHPDLLVACPGAVEATGRVHVLSGRDGTLLRTLDGPDRGAHFGAALLEVGDLDGDGTSDFLVGSPGESATIRGGHAAPIAPLPILSPGTVRAPIPGAGTVIVTRSSGPSGTKDWSEVRLYTQGGATERRLLTATAPFTGLGSQLSLLGDLDGDGLAEVAVEEPGARAEDDIGREQVGAIWILTGAELRRL